MGKRYTVINQRQSEDLSPAGAFVTVMDVTIESAGGHISTVKIPLRDYTVDNVQAALEERVALLDGVHALGD